VVSGFVVGSSYEVRYFENARSGPAPGAEVKIGGVTIVAPHLVSLVGGNNPYHEIVSDAFVATATSMELAFIKSNPQGGDTTLLIDNVSIRPPNTPPSITSQPQDATIGLGDTATFTVGAAGSAPLSYTWFFGSDPFLTGPNPTLTITADFPDVAGNYFAVVANGAGSVTSRVARLIVRDKVTTFFHTGVDDLGAALPDGAPDTHYSLIVNPDSATTVPVVEDSTSFPIVAGPWVANNAGSKWIGPQLNTAGAAGAVGSGGDYIYRIVVDLAGFDPASVVINGQWSTDNEGLDILVNGVSTGQRNTAQFPTFTPFSIPSGLLAGPNNIDFKLNNSAVGYTGLRVDHVSALGTALPAGTTPFIVQQPQSVNPSLGSRVTFNVRANGSAPLSYQWFFGPDALPGETHPELSFTLDFPDQAGDYSVEVSNPFGSVRSSPATLTVRDAPLILTQPQNQTVAVGDNVTFAVTVDGAAPFTFQWTRNGAPIPGATDAMLILNNVTLANAGTYAVRVSNFAGNATSADATLTVLETIPGLFNTGVDGSGVSLASGTVDPHWRITSSVDPGFPGPDALVLNDVGFPIPPWLENDQFSKWIAPQADQSAGNLEGDYNYRTTFDVTGFDPATVRVVGEWAIDNTGLDILANGTSSGQRNDGGFTGWTAFHVDSGFVAGVNTLDFKVNNAPTGVNPTGFRVRNIRALGIRSAPPNRPPVAQADSATTLEGTPVTIDVLANDSDPDGDPIRISASSLPGNGTLTFPNGLTIIYTPNAGFTGTDGFTYHIVDGRGGVASANVLVTVTPRNLPPTAVISTEQLVNLGPDFEHPVLISCNWWNACLIADGWTSSDPENGDLTYLWFLDPDPVPFAAGPVVTNCLEVGVHTLVLVVTDPGGLSGTDSKTIEVVTAPLAIELLIEEINGGSLKSVIPRKIKRELTATLRVALDFSKDNKLRETQKALDAFEKKVRAQVVPDYPLEAAKWIRWSQAVSEGMEKCIKPPRKPKHGGNTKEPNEPTLVTICFQGASIQVPEEQVPAYVNQGASIGPCEN
jgi:hypothetical protein